VDIKYRMLGWASIYVHRKGGKGICTEIGYEIFFEEQPLRKT
jgi:hypothetical protein